MMLRRSDDEERDEHIDMTPMVDVVFQLMTFMLFSLQVSGGEKVDVPPSHHGVGVEESVSTILTLAKAEKAGGEPQLIGGNGSGAPISLDQAKAIVAKGIGEGRKRVIIQADGLVPEGEVIKLIGSLADIEGITIHIGVQAFKPGGGRSANDVAAVKVGPGP